MTTKTQERIPDFTVGDRLRRARQKTGLEQGPFAEEIGVSRGTVSNYERSDNVEGMKKPYLLAWALRTDVPIEWLVTGEAAAPTPPDDGAMLRKMAQQKRAGSRRRRGHITDWYVTKDAAPSHAAA